MTYKEKVLRTKALLAKTTDSLGLNVKIEEQDTETKAVPTVILMHDGSVTYSIEVPKENPLWPLGVSGGRGPNSWHNDLGTAKHMSEAVRKLLTMRAKKKIDGHLQDSRRWLDRVDAKGQAIESAMKEAKRAN